MKRGYTGQVGNEFVFVEAKNIIEAKTKLEEKSNGESWSMDESRHHKVI